ncbi:integral membrane protein [Legionella lansingensis]|uniref:Integral membrane protein n=1 Tax=Legionella lansingensis TaxID=45067 RepID=A0A0W0VXY3_9GAMM|nr:VIT1/CCC1 transporter family protein [Legionella lansingensis]KTD24987.1 integral membrane protein [Legionella lansingensis]SNV48306.1 integral membrane protein [Legionella lansingensis]
MSDLEHGHSKKEIIERFAKAPAQSYLRDWIYGGIDGAVTTFAIVSGVVGGQLSSLVILILGFANLLADGFSMAASNYLGTKSEQEQYQRYKAIEEKHIERKPEGEKKEIRQIFQNKGLTGEALEIVVDEITANRALWISTMLQEEYGLPISIRSPYKSALYTFLAFLCFGFIPLLPYVFNFTDTFYWSCFFTGMTFFIIGSIKSQWSPKSWFGSGLETLIVGLITAVLAYVIGLLLHFYLV